jgi:uncharacterized protein YabE (DUF348 family)
MKSLKHRHPARLSAFLSAFIVLIGLATFLVVGHVPAFATDTQQEGRLVTIHDRGNDTVILTKGNTVGDALKQANISVDANDAVEPAVSQKLVGKDYSVNIYRARPVIVVDGATRQKIITPYQTAQQITKSVGITLYDEDRTALTRTDDIVAEGAGLQLTITRATPFNFTLYGATTVVRTQAKTVGEMLKEKGINIGKDDRISLDQSTPITADMTIRVWREGKQTITVSEDVNFDVQTVQDGDQYIGYHAVQTPGVKGSRNATYEVTIQDGKEVGRTEIASITTKEPIGQIEVIGVKRKTANPAENRLLGHQMMLSAGFDESQWTCLDQLWTRESGWDQYKSNYVGSGAYGIPQALPGSKMGTGWQDDPVAQIQWGLNYIKGRYGTPCGALMDWNAKGWY